MKYPPHQLIREDQAMYDSPRAYFVQYAMPAVHAFRRRMAELEVGVNMDVMHTTHALLALFHMAEHAYSLMQKEAAFSAYPTAIDYQNYLITQCHDFEIAWECANAHKHHTRTHKKRRVTYASQIEESPIATNYVGDGDPYQDYSKHVIVTYDNGTEYDLKYVIENVYAMWVNELHRIGHWDRVVPAGNHRWRPLRRDEVNPEPLAIVLRRAEAAKIQMKWRQYNWVKGSFDTSPNLQAFIMNGPIHVLEQADLEL